MPVGWSGERVRLVPLDKARHFENVLEWINDPTLTEWMLSGDFPMGRLAEEQYFERHLRGAADEVCFAIELYDGTHIGLTSLQNIDYRHGTARSGSLIGRRDLWGQGFGTDSVRVRTRYAFEVLGLRLLLSEVIVGNERSLRALQRVGYREYGRLPRAQWKRGAWRDRILLHLERPDFSG